MPTVEQQTAPVTEITSREGFLAFISENDPTPENLKKACEAYAIYGGFLWMAVSEEVFQENATILWAAYQGQKIEHHVLIARMCFLQRKKTEALERLPQEKVVKAGKFIDAMMQRFEAGSQQS